MPLESKAVMSDSLAGKAVLVTGGARRLGAAIARRLHAAGAGVLIHYRDSEADATKLIAEFNAVRAKSAAKVKAELLAPIARRDRALALGGARRLEPARAALHQPGGGARAGQARWRDHQHRRYPRRAAA